MNRKYFFVFLEMIPQYTPSDFLHTVRYLLYLTSGKISKGVYLGVVLYKTFKICILLYTKDDVVQRLQQLIFDIMKKLFCNLKVLSLKNISRDFHLILITFIFYTAVGHFYAIFAQVLSVLYMKNFFSL